MDNDAPSPVVSPAKPKRWPLALLIAFITGVVGAFIAVPVSDWAMEAHHVSTREGGRACVAVGIFAPLVFLVGAVVGFVCGVRLVGSGLAGFLKRQAVALVAIGVIVCSVGGLGYATAERPPVLDGRTLALDIEVRVPAKGQTVEELKAAGFNVALVVTTSDRHYSEMRWSDATRTEEFITVRAWAPLNSRNARREITAGFAGENRQIFDVVLPASPKSTGDAWTEWLPPRARFDGSKPAPDEQYFVRYRVRFESEYLPTPHPTLPESSPSAEEPEPEPTP